MRYVGSVRPGARAPIAGTAPSSCTRKPLTAAALAQADCVAILTDHRLFDYDLVRRSAPVVVDTRNAIAGRHPNVFRLGAPAPTDTAAMPPGADEGLSDDAAPDAQAVA